MSLRLTALAACVGFLLPLQAAERWTELNIGPFYVDTQGDVASARDVLTQLEQLRWVLGGLLESKDLPTVWPIRVVLSPVAKKNPLTAGTEFVLQNGSYQLLTAADSHLPLGQVAAIFLEANSPRIPQDVEDGIQQLFDTLEAHGSRVTWGGTPSQPNLGWARMQLFATKFEYSASFHIFLNALRGGSTVRAAEHNAFGRDADVLEKEAAANLAKGSWEPVSVSGRPLDPKRDFGEHSVSAALAEAYIANTQLNANPEAAEAAYKAAIEDGGAGVALGNEGLAQIARLKKEDAQPFLENAMRAGSKSAPIYVAAAQDRSPAAALSLLKQASALNPRWAEPIFRQVQLTSDLREKEALLKQATKLDPRISEYWIELAQVQLIDGHAMMAQGSWLRAEDSAKNEAERERIHQMREAAETQRLDAMDADRRRERESVHLADQRAQASEMDRIHAAEQKANSSLDSGGGAIGEVIPYGDLAGKKISGQLTQVDCVGKAARLTVKKPGGQSVILLLRNASSSRLACGPQRPPHRVTASYTAQPDDTHHTVGEILSLEWQ